MFHNRLQFTYMSTYSKLFVATWSCYNRTQRRLKLMNQKGWVIGQWWINYCANQSDLTSFNIIQRHPNHSTSSNVTQHHPMSSNIIKQFWVIGQCQPDLTLLTFNLIQHHPTSSHVIKQFWVIGQCQPDLMLTTNTIQRHPTSSNVIKHQPTSPNIIQRHLTSSNTIQPSSNIVSQDVQTGF